MHHQLRQAHRLLDEHIRSARNLFHIACRLFRLGIQLRHVLAIELHGDIRLGSGHQLIEAQLDWLREVELGTLRQRFQSRFHLLHHLRPRGGTHPLLKGFHHDHDIRVFHRHRIGRHLRRTNLGDDMLDLGELLFQRLLCQAGKFNTLAQ